jgi:hypothetical protein
VISQAYLPNSISLGVTPSDTSWRVVASDGTTYTTLALLVAAGKTPFPAGNTFASIVASPCRLYARSDASGSDGSNFYVATNQKTAPTTGQLIDGSGGQQLVIDGPFQNLWLKTNGTDQIDLLFQY